MANLTEATARLGALLRLPVGWDYGDGVPLSRAAYNHACQALSIIKSLGATDFEVVPGSDDGAVIVGYRGQKSAEIHCTAAGRFDLHHEDGDSSETLENLPLDGLICALEGYGWQSPRFYASCTRSVSYPENVAMPLSPLKIRVVGVCPSSAQRAWHQSLTVPVITSVSTTQPTPAVSRQSSGDYRSLTFLPELA